MKLPTASLGFKINVALLLFVLVLGIATLAIVLYGFNRTQDNANTRSREALEEEGKLALEAFAGGLSDSGALQFETAAEVGQHAGRYMQDFAASGATAQYDSSRLVRTENGIWYDPDPDRISDIIVINGGKPDDEAVRNDIAYTAALDSIFPALAEGFPGQLTGEAYNPTAIVYAGLSGVGRYYPPIGIEKTTPPEIDISDFIDRFGPIGNPDRLTLWTPPYEDLQGRGLVITAQTPMYNGDTFLGVMEVDLSVSQLVDLVNRLKPTDNGFTFYVDTDGGILQTNAYDFLSNEAESNTELTRILDAMTEPLPPTETGVVVEKLRMNDEDYFIAYTPMTIPGGAIGVAAPVDEITARASSITAGIENEGNRTFLIILAAMSALFILGLIGATVLNRRLLLDPLGRLFAGTRAVTVGDLDTRVELKRGDELGMLADSFNSMVEQLRESERNLERQVQERTAELHAIIEISRILASAQNLRSLVETILDQIKTVIDYTGASVVVFRENEIEIIDSVGPEGREANIAGLVAPIDHGARFWHLLLEGQPVILADARSDDPLSVQYRELISSFGLPEFTYIRSWLAIPLTLEGRVIGMLTMSRDTADYFTDRHVEIAQTVARQAAVVARNAQLIEETQRVARERASLLEVSRAVTSTLDLRELMEVILDQLQTMIDYAGAAVMLRTDNSFQQVAVRRPRGPVVTPADLTSKIPLDAYEALGIVPSRDSYVVIDDAYGDSPAAVSYRSLYGGNIKGTPVEYVHSFISLPLVVRDDFVGLLAVAHDEAGYLTDEHARLLRPFANQAAIAIENARLFERAQGVAALEERQRLARELHDSVSQALYGIALGARTAKAQLERDPDKAAEPVDYILSLAEAGLAEMRSLIFELRPESMEKEGLVAALDKQIAAGRARYAIQIDTDICDEPDASLEVKEALYRIAQEALHNVVKHARATHVSLSLAHNDGRLVLRVTDDGAGFDPGKDYAGHLGLKSMRERVMLLGGTIEIDSSEGEGTTIVAELPAR